ncbi:gypsy retrotransposon integrase 1 [Labeo rohita]|uniref:ribonuclease H n=1 Tax=Labeo rohita TaxID=84645 RepID=A0A498MFI5_LABRO|nr:gypsy retrotransposon integrase 1 [Labeo rohita]
MKNFIRKGFLPTEEQGEEILIHLRGKAKDVVKVGMLSSGLDIRTNPDAIYSLLRKHFSCQQFSPIPLQDFYTTLPEPQEDPFDYWLRLNRTADITAECLKQQGKVLDNQLIEVTRMFIRNCPNSDLALTFRSKTIDKWTAYEVQEILNEYHSEKNLRATGKGNRPSDCEKKFSVNEMHVIDMLERVLMNNSGNAQAVKEHRKRSNMSRIPDLPLPKQIQSNLQCTEEPLPIRSSDEMKQVLSDLNLDDLDLESCEVSAHWKDKLLHIIEKYESVFSRDKMDCGEAKGFVHRINLTDDRPFRFPYRRIPPSQYAKLRTVLNEMEEKGIIRKSHSDYASPLVLVWKKNGDLRICTDFRWLNARTVRDAYPLPHQSDVLAALGGNAFFSTMDLTSGYYNVPLEEEHKKYTAFSSPFGLHEYNRLPQGLSNSPATFMRMMMSVFGDENFSSVLCYLDDLMVFAPSQSVALQRLEMVLSRLSHHNLKLAPKKCCFLRRSVKFLGHIISEEGIKTDPGKVEAINEIQASDLMEPDGKTPCQKKIRVPRLPVDVLFQNVLLNEDVVDYKDFVSKLRKDLREAAHIARMHTLKEQERHGKIYNRKVKGCPLTVGDRVLVANRGEKGRRKVADKWESSPYEVMTVYPDINVYRIREINSDKVRVVHRNLLLPVNFLPVDDPQEQDGKDDDVNDEIDVHGNKVDLDDRTANWILSHPDGFEEEDGRTNCTDLLVVSDCVSEILDSASTDAENLQERSDVNVISDVERSDVNVTSDVDLPEVEGQDSNLTQREQVTDEVTKEPVVCTQPRHVEAAVTRTRLGRVIKPPKRLIYEMNKQHIDNSDSTGNFSTDDDNEVVSDADGNFTDADESFSADEEDDVFSTVYENFPEIHVRIQFEYSAE